MKQKVYIVLGVYGSDISFISKALVDQGVYIEGRFEKGQGPKSLRRLDFLKLNGKILKKSKGSFDNPPTRYDLGQAGRTYEIKESIKKAISKVEVEKWGWEDPRACLTLPYFLELLDKRNDVYLISVFRRPSFVAKNLEKEYGFSFAKASGLTKLYNQVLVENIASFIDISLSTDP